MLSSEINIKLKKLKSFVTCKIYYFKLGIISFNSYVYYLSRGFIASTRASNLPTCAFNLPTRAFNLATRTFSLLTHRFELVTRGFELVTRRFELVIRGFEIVTRFTLWKILPPFKKFSVSFSLCSPLSPSQFLCFNKLYFFVD